MTSYVVTHLAEADIDDVITYIAQDDVQAAHRFLEDLYHTFDLLVDNPAMGYERPALTTAPVRFWPFKKHYVVVYQPENPLTIVRVLSGFREITLLVTS